MEALDVLRKAADEAQTELGAAEIALIEATARAESARNEYAKLEAAVAALSGEPPPAAASAPAEAPIEAAQGGNAASNPADEGSSPSQPANSRDEVHEMTPEEFDAHRKKRQRQKEKEAQANNPYAHIKCSGCGSLGTMQDTILQAPSGAPIRMMTCGRCGNQLMQ